MPKQVQHKNFQIKVMQSKVWLSTKVWTSVPSYPTLLSTQPRGIVSALLFNIFITDFNGICHTSFYFSKINFYYEIDQGRPSFLIGVGVKYLNRLKLINYAYTL